MPETTSSSQFPGFDLPQQNWFKMPKNWTDITAEISSIAELKIVEYVLKHTWGYQEYGVKKAITIDEFRHGRKRKDGSRLDKGTGLSKQSVITGVRAAVRRGLLHEEVDDRDKARVKKSYFLRMKQTSHSQGERRGVNKLDADVKKLDTGVQGLDIGGQTSGHRTEQETSERNLQQENDNGSSVEIAAALVKRGIEKKMAQRLISQYKSERLFNNIDWYDHTLKTQPQKASKNPAGLLFRAIESNYAGEDNLRDFQTREQKAVTRTQQKKRLAAQEKLSKALKRKHKASQQQKENARLRRLETLRERYHSTAEERRIWQDVLNKLSKELSPLKFKTYLAQTELLVLHKERAIVIVSTRFIKDWIEVHLSTSIQQLLAGYGNTQQLVVQYQSLDGVEVG